MAKFKVGDNVKNLADTSLVSFGTVGTIAKANGWYLVNFGIIGNFYRNEDEIALVGSANDATEVERLKEALLAAWGVCDELRAELRNLIIKNA